MAAIFAVYDSDDDLVSELNPINFGAVQRGVPSDTISIWIWNDRDEEGADASEAPLIFAIKVDDDVDGLFAGTEANGYRSMLQAKSCGAIRTPADMDQQWTPIGPLETLSLGRMPANSARLIELRLYPPHDSLLFDESVFSIRVSG
jgi:hypothetical protein